MPKLMGSCWCWPCAGPGGSILGGSILGHRRPPRRCGGAAARAALAARPAPAADTKLCGARARRPVTARGSAARPAPRAPPAAAIGRRRPPSARPLAAAAPAPALAPGRGGRRRRGDITGAREQWRAGRGWGRGPHVGGGPAPMPGFIPSPSPASSGPIPVPPGAPRPAPPRAPTARGHPARRDSVPAAAQGPASTAARSGGPRPSPRLGWGAAGALQGEIPFGLNLQSPARLPSALAAGPRRPNGTQGINN